MIHKSLFVTLLLLTPLAVLAAEATNAAAASAPATSPNWAITPVENQAKNNYSVDQRHAAILAIKAQLNPQIVLIGDSITMFWDGPPDKKVRPSWKETFGDIPTLNMGFGYDLTQNVLWRLDHGEFDGLKPKVVVIEIGTNNLTGAGPVSHATKPPQTVEGILAIADRVKAMSPQTRIIVMALFPRGTLPNNPLRVAVDRVNAALAAAMASRPDLTLLDIGSKFVQPDGTIPRTLMGDGTHPTEAGYRIWGQALVDAGIRDGLADAAPASSPASATASATTPAPPAPDAAVKDSSAPAR